MKIRMRSVVIGALMLVFLWTGNLVAQPKTYDAQVNAGVAYFRQRADQQLPLVKVGIHSQFEPYKAILEPAISEEVESAYKACLETLKPFFRTGQVAAAPYSSVKAEQRGAIVKASYRYRDALIKAKTALKIPDPV